MNIEKLTELKGWLEAGAPHVVFNMGFQGDPVYTIEREEFHTEAADKGLGECGTVCCIAGYVIERHFGAEDLNHRTWEEVAKPAAEILGIPYNADLSPFGHPLFDPSLAPINCTPQQAAQAVQNVINGKEPW